jgi:hypothetical protein
MVKPPKRDGPQAEAASPGVSERLLLFCVASQTERERAGIAGATVSAMVRGLIERDVAGELTLTKQGRAVLAALLMTEDEKIAMTKGVDMAARTSDSVSACLADWVVIGDSMPPRDPNDDDDDEEEEDGDAEPEEDEPAVIREPDE